MADSRAADSVLNPQLPPPTALLWLQNLAPPIETLKSKIKETQECTTNEKRKSLSFRSSKNRPKEMNKDLQLAKDRIEVMEALLAVYRDELEVIESFARILACFLMQNSGEIENQVLLDLLQPYQNLLKGYIPKSSTAATTPKPVRRNSSKRNSRRRRSNSQKRDSGTASKASKVPEIIEAVRAQEAVVKVEDIFESREKLLELKYYGGDFRKCLGIEEQVVVVANSGEIPESFKKTELETVKIAENAPEPEPELEVSQTKLESSKETEEMFEEIDLGTDEVAENVPEPEPELEVSMSSVKPEEIPESISEPEPEKIAPKSPDSIKTPESPPEPVEHSKDTFKTQKSVEFSEKPEIMHNFAELVVTDEDEGEAGLEAKPEIPQFTEEVDPISSSIFTPVIDPEAQINEPEPEIVESLETLDKLLVKISNSQVNFETKTTEIPEIAEIKEQIPEIAELETEIYHDAETCPPEVKDLEASTETSTEFPDDFSAYLTDVILQENPTLALPVINSPNLNNSNFRVPSIENITKPEPESKSEPESETRKIAFYPLPINVDILVQEGMQTSATIVENLKNDKEKSALNLKDEPENRYGTFAEKDIPEPKQENPESTKAQIAKPEETKIAADSNPEVEKSKPKNGQKLSLKNGGHSKKKKNHKGKNQKTKRSNSGRAKPKCCSIM